MSATGWVVVACAALVLRVLGALAVGSRRVPAWSGPVADVLLWTVGPAVLGSRAPGDVASWVGLVVMVLLWGPVLAVARRSRELPTARAAAVVGVVVLAVTTQALVTQGLVAATISEVTEGRVCQFPRKPYGVAGDTSPATGRHGDTSCVQGRPGGGYLGD